ncbi:hypothetical protein AB0D67_36590 [Streptosporangium sp. NPDC048047]|uniref:hypothetical protein n=1 Tax=Streptosporangium sp. NPDC048047 TaxID=3155748 RepID=UPI00342D081C
MTGSGRATGRVLDTAVMRLITFGNGLITEIRPFYLDTIAVAEALGVRGTPVETA